MRTIWVGILSATMLLVQPVLGQTDVAALETALHGKPLVLRSYAADPVVKYTYVDGKLLLDPVVLHGMEIFLADTARQKGSKILIEGQVETLVRNEGKLAPMGRIPMQIEVELQGASPAVVLPQLQALLFFPSIKAALGGLPEYVADMLPFPSDNKYEPACHCAHVLQDGKWIQADGSTAKLTPPGFIKIAPNDDLNQMGIDEKVSGSITLIYFVSETGHVEDVWLAKPLSSALDQSAAKKGRTNLYQPATLDGKPVGAVMIQSIPVN